MEAVLYERMINAERLDDIFRSGVDKLQRGIGEFQTLLKTYGNFPGYQALPEYKNLSGFSAISSKDIPKIDIFKVHKNIMDEYTDNPVFHDSVTGEKTIEQTVIELGQVNKGIRKILPRKKNKIHNERLEQVGNLVGYSSHLEALGIWVPENLIWGLGAAALGIASVYLAVGNLIPPDQVIGNSKSPWGALGVLYSVAGPALGICLQTKRLGHLPIEKAKYLDQKIEELYK